MSQRYIVIYTRYKIVDNCYAINPSLRSSLVCSCVKLDTVELWNKKLRHINYKDLVKIVNRNLVRGVTC